MTLLCATTRYCTLYLVCYTTGWIVRSITWRTITPWLPSFLVYSSRRPRVSHLCIGVKLPQHHFPIYTINLGMVKNNRPELRNENQLGDWKTNLCTWYYFLRYGDRAGGGRLAFVKTSARTNTLHFRIEPRHVEIHVDGSKTFISPCTQTAVVIVNGIKVREKTQLNQGVND